MKDWNKPITRKEVTKWAVIGYVITMFWLIVSNYWIDIKYFFIDLFEKIKGEDE